MLAEREDTISEEPLIQVSDKSFKLKILVFTIYNEFLRLNIKYAKPKSPGIEYPIPVAIAAPEIPKTNCEAVLFCR